MEQGWCSQVDLARRHKVSVKSIQRWEEKGRVERCTRPGQLPVFRYRQSGPLDVQRSGHLDVQRSGHRPTVTVTRSGRPDVQRSGHVDAQSSGHLDVQRSGHRPATRPPVAQVEKNLATELRAAPKPKARPRPAPKVAPATETVQELLRIVAAAQAEAPAQSNSTSSAQSNSTSSAGSMNPEWVWFTLGTLLSGGVTWWAIRDFKRRHQVELRRARRRLIQQRKVVELEPVRRRRAAGS
jgi:hypothetical protein